MLKTPKKYISYYTIGHILLRNSTYLSPEKYISFNENPLYFSISRFLNKINKKKNDVYVNLTQLIHADAITKYLEHLEELYTDDFSFSYGKIDQNML